jgi:hypothetical protein
MGSTEQGVQQEPRAARFLKSTSFASAELTQLLRPVDISISYENSPQTGFPAPNASQK